MKIEVALKQQEALAEDEECMHKIAKHLVQMMWYEAVTLVGQAPEAHGGRGFGGELQPMQAAVGWGDIYPETLVPLTRDTAGRSNRKSGMPSGAFSSSMIACP
jgi:hypothetical protein